MTVNIPVYGIHHDEQIYPNPEVYDPDRFTPDEVQKRHPLSFLAFGNGPRNCIGLRFGLMQARVGLAMMLGNFEFFPCNENGKPLVLNKKSLILTPKEDLKLLIKKV